VHAFAPSANQIPLTTGQLVLKANVGKFGGLFCIMEFFLMNDQPFTCPYCGSRCLIIGDFLHTKARLYVQECLGVNCTFIGAEVEGADYLIGIIK
jgi:hypothetical protein